MPKSIQQSLPPMLLPNETHSDPVRPKDTQAADALAAQLFDEALTASGLTTADVAYLLHCSESLVRRMRSHDARERISFPQLLKLPPSFHWALHKAMNRHFGFGRQALLDLLDAAGRLAVVGAL